MSEQNLNLQTLINCGLPNEVYVSGMRFDLQGWNGKYVRSQDGSFVLNSYTLYGCIEIFGTRIYFKNGVWYFKRERDNTFIFSNNALEGSWNGGFFVSRQESHSKKLLFLIGLLSGTLGWIVLKLNNCY